MKKKIGIMLSILFIAVFISGISVYAYLRNTAGSQAVNGSSAISANNEVNVASFTDLFTNGTDSNYNNKDVTSTSTDRKVLKLTADITLSSDLVLTKDVQINLNGHTLNLNNHVLTFKHGYAGCSGIYSSVTGGVIETGLVTEGESQGKIVVDLLKSGFTTNTNVSYKKNNVSSTEALTIQVLNIDEKYTAYSALYMVGRALNSSLNQGPDFENYLTVSDAGFTLTVDKFLPSMVCETADTTEYCAYVYKDLDLPLHYLSSDISITYTSTNAAVISPKGNVSITANSTDVNLTATISKIGWTNSYAVVFKLHAVEITDTATKNMVAKTLIKSYLQPYRKDEQLVVNQSIIFTDYYYGFNHAIELPKTAFDGTITYTYSITDFAGTSEVTGRISNVGSIAYFEPSTACFHLVVNNESLNMYSTYVSTKESAAYLILNHLYGGAIIYDKTVSSMLLQTVDRINANDDLTVVQELLTTYGVTAINYAVKASSTADTYYTITSNALSVRPGAVPPDKADYITVTFTFSDSSTVVIDVYVDYLDAQGSTLSSFLTYYSIYDPEVPSEPLFSFEMPFAYNDSATSSPHLIAPYIVYDVAVVNSTSTYGTGDSAFDYYNFTYNKPVNLNIQLYYNGAVTYTFPAYTSQASFSAQLDNYLSSQGLTLATVPHDAKYIFSINAQESLTENQRLIIIYNYKFNASDTDWTQYSNRGYLTELNTTPFTVLGGLFYDNDDNSSALHAVKDQTFFLWIFNKFKPSHVGTLVSGAAGEVEISLDSATTIIPIDWLGQDVLISSSDTALSSVTNYSGIGYLKNVTTVDLSNREVSASVLTGLAGMPSLTTLTLKNCSLTSISALANLTTVKVLDISNNQIGYFDDLSEVTCLEKVYLYNNLPSGENANYIGSTGICSFQAFADLMRNGCAVYNTVSNSIPVLYAESYSINDYRRLKALVYQDKLKTGLDITKLYEDFEDMGSSITTKTGDARINNTQPFGLQTAGRLDWGYEPGATPGTATYFYVTLTYSSGYVLKVKYYVDRY